MRIVCWQTTLMNIIPYFFRKIGENVAKFVVCCSRDWRFLLQKYDSKLRSLSAHEAAYRPNFHTIDGKISKMRASVDIAKRLYEYCQLQEISARAHLIQVTQFRSINSLKNRTKRKSFICLFCFVALRPKSTAMVMAERSVLLTTLVPGQA